jgi:F-type H+-transporting ATPase subunit epsilon
MANTYQQSVLTPERVVLEQRGISLVAPGSQGYLGILASHAPLITDLIPGKLTLKDEQGREQIFAVSGGFLEVSDNRATVLADAVESPDDIDIERARKARERAVERLKDTKAHWDTVRARAALLRALNRLRVAGGTR